MGTRARRMAAVPLRPTVTTLRSPSDAAISRAAKRMVLVLSEPARPRSVVKRTMRRAPAPLLGEQRVLLVVDDGGHVREDLVELVAVRPRRQGGVLRALQLRGSHELHGAGDLLDVADRSDAAPDLALAGHGWVPTS